MQSPIIFALVTFASILLMHPSPSNGSDNSSHSICDVQLRGNQSDGFRLYGQTREDNSTRSIEEALANLISLGLDEGVILVSSIEDILHSKAPYNPFDSTELNSAIYRKMFETWIPLVDWEKLQALLRELLSRKEDSAEIQEEDIKKTEMLPLTPIRSEEVNTKEGTVQLLFELKGPDGYRTLMVLLRKEDDLSLRTYDPVKGLGKTPYPLSGKWRQPPVLFRRKQKLYIATILKDGIEIFRFEPNSKSERAPQAEVRLEYTRARDVLGLKSKRVAPERPVKVFYDEDRPILFFSSEYETDYFFLSLDYEDLSKLDLSESVGMRRWRGMTVPLVIHQGGLPEIGFSLTGQIFKVRMAMTYENGDGLDQEGSIQKVSFFTENQLSEVPYTRDSARKNDFLKNFSLDDVDGEPVYLYNFILQGGRMRAEDRAYVWLYWPKSGRHELIECPPYTRPKEGVGAKLFRIGKHSDSGLMLVSKLEDQRDNYNPYSPTTGRIFTYRFDQKRWTAYEKSLGVSLSGNSVWESNGPSHKPNSDLLNKHPSKMSQFLLVRFHETINKSGEIDIDAKNPNLGLVDIDTGELVALRRVENALFSSDPYVYETEDEWRIVMLTTRRRLEHFYLGPK